MNIMKLVVDVMKDWIARIQVGSVDSDDVEDLHQSRIRRMNYEHSKQHLKIHHLPHLKNNDD